MRIAKIVAAAGLSAVLSAGIAGAAEEPIKIGAFVSATGTMTFLGDPEKRTLETYVDRINKKGGVLGRQVKLVIYDDQSDNDKAASFAKRLIESDKVDLIVGGSGTPTSLAAIPLIERAQIPYVSMGGGVAIVDPVKTWTFKVPHTDRMAAEKVFLDMKKRGISKIALLSENVGFGKSGHDQTVALAPKYGIEILVDEVYGPKDSDVTAQLTKIRGAKDAQALFVFGTGAGPAVVSKNIRQMGLALPVYQSHGVASKDFLKLVGDAAEGMRLPAAGLVVAEQLAASDPQKPVVTEFKKVYEDTFKTDVSTFAGHAYDALHIAIEAVKRAGSVDRAKVRDEIERTKGFVGTAGIVNMSAGDHMGLGLDAFHMVEIRNGNWVLVD